MRKLKEPLIKEQAQARLNNEIKSFAFAGGNNYEQQLNNLSTTIENIKDDLLQPDKVTKKSWMTREILQLMEERRKVKEDFIKYNEKNKMIKRKIREAKEAEMKDMCTEIETLQARHDSFNVNKKVKELTGTCRRRQITTLTNNEGKTIIDKDDLKDTWREYIQQLFHDTRPEPPEINDNTGPYILIDEVNAAIKSMKEGKSSGPDNMNKEFLKLMDDHSIKWITSIFNKVYTSGEIPQVWLKSEFVTLPKKPGAKKCEDYRTISLMSHLLKLFLKIIHRRIYKTCEDQISPTQFGFRNAVGTREAIYSIQVLF